MTVLTCVNRLPVAASLGFVTLTAAFGSSIFSAATSHVASEFGVSREVGILGVSLYVLGFATGPVYWSLTLSCRAQADV